MNRKRLKIAIIHNDYGKFSGEEAVVEQHIALLKSRGHEVVEFRRSSEELKGTYGQIKGLLCGIYNPFSIRKFAQFVDKNKPDIIHIHNLHPLITPWILPEAKKRKIPVVMTIHNFRLFCPNGLFFQNGKICEECSNNSRLRCIKNNCLDSLPKSIGYALRDTIHDRRSLYYNNIDAFLCLSSFQKNKLVSYGLPESKCHIIHNFINIGKKQQATGISNEIVDCGLQITDFNSELKTKNSKFSTPLPTSPYVAYAGRLSEEKGIDLIIKAAKLLPHIKFKLAGSITSKIQHLTSTITPPLSNIEFLGHLPNDKLIGFFKNAKIQIMASRCYEGFPATLLTGMSLGLPSIVPNHGAMPEIIVDSGLTFDIDYVESLVEKIELLWNNQELCIKLGSSAFKKCLKNYNSTEFYNRLMDIYMAHFELT